jgi:hypothetical protein
MSLSAALKAKVHPLKQIDSSLESTGNGSGGVSDGMRSRSSMGLYRNLYKSIAYILSEVKW